MKTFATKDNYDLLIKNGDFAFDLDAKAILTIAKQMGETLYGEIPNYPNLGILRNLGMPTFNDTLEGISRLTSRVKKIPGVTNAVISDVIEKDQSLIYLLSIFTIYQAEFLSLKRKYYYG